MGSYVTLITAELFRIDDLKLYAMQRLRRFHHYTMEQGAFTEYNSPTYTIVALQEIGRLRADVKDPEAKRLAEDIYRVAWEEIASHFHAATRQWAGPHSRCYSTLLPQKVLGLVQHATEGRIRFFSEDPPRAKDEFGLRLPCPRDLEHFFTKLEEPRELVKTFIQGENPVIGTTYLTPQFTLGSINRGDLWNQRRSLIAYWGAATAPAYLHLRFLHDGYDFADAQFFSAQKKGTVLAGVVFGTDGGDTHVSLDRIKNATISAHDLRLRFEFGGAAGLQKQAVPDDIRQPIKLTLGRLNLSLQVAFARFGQADGRFESTVDPAKKTVGVDLVFHTGSRRQFRQNEVSSRPRLVFASNCPVPEAPAPGLASEATSGLLKMTTTSPELRLDLPLKPAKVSDLQQRRP